MSKLRINENQHLGKQELNRLQFFLSDDGYKKFFKKIVRRFGIIRDPNDLIFDSLRVIPGLVSGTVSVMPGNAIDSNINMITVNELFEDGLVVVPPDSIQRKAIISYAESSQEEGTVSIDALGNLTGTGTKFLSVLRGAPHHPVKIRIDQGANLQEYQVLSVSSDTSAVLQGGTFTPESDKKYRVVGTFIPGVSVPPTSKFIYRYDGYQFSVVNLSYVLGPDEYELARVSYDGVTLDIQDSRYDSLFAVINEQDSQSTVTQSSDLVGIESLKRDNIYGPKDYNVARVGWGLRTNLWTSDFPNSKIVVSAASGGFYQDISTVVNDQFNNWRVYFENGLYVNIIDTQLISSQIHLILSGYNPILHPSSGKITIVPEADFIHLKYNRSSLSEDLISVENSEAIFPIKDGFADFRVKAGSSSGIIRYKFELRGTYSSYNTMESGQPYLSPASFDEFGNLTSSVFVNTQAPDGMFDNSVLTDNFYDFKAWINKNNIFAANTTNDFLGITIFNKTLSLKTNLLESFVTQPDGILQSSLVNTHVVLVCDSSNVVINGISNTYNGKILVIRNSHDSTFNCTLLHDNCIDPTLSMNLPSSNSVVIKPGESVTLIYDDVKNFWVYLSGNVRLIEPWRTVGDPGQPSFLNDFTYFPGNPLNVVQFRKDSNGIVHFRGALDGRASYVAPGGLLNAFNMPEGYRPSTNATALLVNQDVGGAVISDEYTEAFVQSTLIGNFVVNLKSLTSSVHVWRLDGQISYFAAE